MTSEIAAMNQRCVALAADSAVTLTDGRKVVVRNERRKLFELAPGVPVGVMYFGDAVVMGHPWDVVIGHFAGKGRFASHPEVKGYAAEFLGKLDRNEEFFPRDAGKDEYRRLLAQVFRYVAQLAQFLKRHPAEGLGSDGAILGRSIELIWRHYQFREDGTARRDLDCFPPGFGEKVAHDHAAEVEELISRGFGAGPDEGMKAKLRDIAAFAVVKDVFLEDVTGLVFAGYGSSERYPAIATYNVSAVIEGIVKRAVVGTESIDNELRSGITLFADCEATYAFLRGIEMELEARIFGTLAAINEALVDQVLASVPSLAAGEREAIKKQFQEKHLPQTLNRFLAQLTEFQRRAYIEPVLGVLEIATKQDMAETARELVALNIFKKRIMARQPTAGGDIDVAVISRDEGFKWWKRQGEKS